MMEKISSFLLIFVLLLSNLVLAKDFEGADAISSLEWQTVRLQESIEKKIIKSLRPVIKEDDYIIEVKIGVDKDAMSSPSSKMITKKKQTTKIKFSTEEKPKEGDDYIVFNKLGLEAPVFGDEPVETQTSEAELNQKALIELTDRYNLFNYLKTIDINLTFDSGLNDQTKQVIRKVVAGLTFNISEVTPQINSQFLDLKANQIKGQTPEGLAMGGAGGGKGGDAKLEGKLQQLNAKKEVPKWFEFFRNVDLMIGLILAAAIMGLSLFLIARYFIKSAEAFRKEDAAAKQVAETRAQEASKEPENENDEEENLEEEDDMKIDLTKTDPVTVRIAEGLERFRKALANHHDDTILMLKGWVKSRTEAEMNALSAIVTMLDDFELSDLFKTMTHDERSTWKALLHSELTKEEISNSFVFVSNKITEMLMVPSLINDYETCDLLLELSAKEAARFSQEDMELGVVLTNVLSSNIIGEMFKIMDPDMVADLIDRSATFSPDKIETVLPVLKTKLETVKAKREKPPFLKRIIDILPGATAELEKKLYATLLKYFTEDEVKLTAIKIFPRSLVAQVPDEVYKKIVELMPIETQVQYFASMENDQRDTMLDKFAPNGSKGREMIDVELSVILKNEVALRRLQNEKRERLQQEFLSYTRQLISGNQDIQREVIDQIESWFTEINDTENEGLAA